MHYSNAMEYLWILLVFFFITWDVAVGLRCFQCVNTKLSGEGFVKHVFGKDRQLKAACDSASVFRDTEELEVVTCDEGEKCGALKGSVAVDVPFLGTVTTETLARTCMPIADSFTGCVPGTHIAAQILTALFAEEGTSFDGEVCFCDTDFCAAGDCPGGLIKTGQYCVEWYILFPLILLGVGGVVVFFWWCCVCRSKKRGSMNPFDWV